MVTERGRTGREGPVAVSVVLERGWCVCGQLGLVFEREGAGAGLERAGLYGNSLVWE